ncbi:MAG: hypothetical protein H6R15_2237 [Proteobacteria bacterium]|nr:hypothetical protein [Pseudomonadota bacterium]
MSKNQNTDLRDACEGTVAFASLGDEPPLLGTVTHVASTDGKTRPAFSLWARHSHLPAIELLDENGTAPDFEVADYTLAEFLAVPHRQRLAEFYKVACQRFGWVRDQHATLNVIYRLEQAGIREIDHDNLDRAMHIAHAATQAVYAYVRQFTKLKLAA